MKRFLFSLLFIILLCGNVAFSQSWISLDNTKVGQEFTINTIKSDVTSYKIKVKIHGFYDESVSKNGVDYHHLYMKKGFFLQKVGEPQLPVISQMIAIPEGATYKVSIVEENWKDIRIGKVYPAQQDHKESEPEPRFQILDSIYRKDYSPSIVHIGDEQIWNNIRNIGISICPFKYFPAQDKLSVLTDFLLEVVFTNTSKESHISASAISDATKWHMFDNQISDFPVITADKENAKSSASSDNYDYLIIVGNIPSILNSQALKDFRKWKAFKGYKTKVVSTTTISTSQAEIKSYIRQEKIKGIKYVLFIGDIDKIPTKVISFYGYSDFFHQEDTVKSDYWYGCLDGDYDFQAEILIGRFSTNSLSDFQNMVNKTINYERYYSGNYKKTLLVAHKEGAPNNYQGCCENIRTQFINDLFFTKAYGAPVDSGGNNATNAQVVNYINSGMHIVNYRGHGEPKHWGLNYPEFNPWNHSLQLFWNSEINNIDSCSIYFNVCCQTGNISEEPCFMETFTRSSKGAIACLAATEDTYTEQNHIYNKQLFEKLLDNDCWNLGNLNSQAHIGTYDFCDNDIRAAFNAYAYICGGDPTLEIWTGTPASYTDVSLAKTNGNIVVSSPSFNSSDTISVVSEDGELINRYGISGNACSFSAPSGNYYVVVNRHNYYPHITYCSNSGYIQNETLTGNNFYSATPLNIGYNVTTEKPYGNVVISSGGKLSIQKGTGGVTIKNGFECELGGELIIK